MAPSPTNLTYKEHCFYTTSQTGMKKITQVLALQTIILEEIMYTILKMSAQRNDSVTIN